MASGAGAPEGNSNYKKGKAWQQALKRALSKQVGDTYDVGLLRVAEVLVREAMKGERWAIEEIGNRFDGKPAQSVTVDGDGEGGPVKTLSEIIIRAVDAAGNQST